MVERARQYDWPGNVRELRNLCERLVIRARQRAVVDADLPFELRPAAAAPAAPARPTTRTDELYMRLVHGGESFWAAVYTPFMDRDLTRDDLRALVARGLTETHGSYTALLRLFNMERSDYKRFLNVLQKHGCHLPVTLFRSGALPRPLPIVPADAYPPGARTA